MRGFLASSVGVTCAIALALPLALPAAARSAPHPDPASPDTPAAPAAPARPATPARPAAPSPPVPPGGTQSLALAPRPADRVRPPGTPEQGLAPRGVRPFSLVGVVWEDAAARLDGRVQVRTRATGTADWSGWQDLDVHQGDHGADPGSDEARPGRVRGATAPLWVGDSDGVEARVTGHPSDDRTHPGRTSPGRDRAAALPRGLRLELVDPGPEPEAGSGVDSESDPAPRARTATRTAPRARTATRAVAAEPPRARAAAPAKRYIGPRPGIVSRKKWGADEGLRDRGFVYTTSVKAAFVHHSATGNNYRCSQSPSVIRGIYRYHVRSSGWRDLGYNFLIDKCGTVYEGRAGGVTKAVLGAHTLGFNAKTMGIAVLGSYGRTKVSSAAVKAIAKLTAWKLGLYGANPRGKTYLTSGGGNLYRKGKKVRLHVISGHRDGFNTACPGARLYSKLGTARSTSARLQGR
ncbi:peptidoglycan recognition protein [Streptomyces uncialis]|uniref:peptidoglycan recognition protein family protein n=1 Tax=Streptomyces uncialis TaxID=1048205 RepID=UPI0037F5E56F